jgi:hypothetical protein
MSHVTADFTSLLLLETCPLMVSMSFSRMHNMTSRYVCPACIYLAVRLRRSQNNSWQLPDGNMFTIYQSQNIDSWTWTRQHEQVSKIRQYYWLEITTCTYSKSCNNTIPPICIMASIYIADHCIRNTNQFELSPITLTVPRLVVSTLLRLYLIPGACFSSLHTCINRSTIRRR